MILTDFAASSLRIQRRYATISSTTLLRTRLALRMLSYQTSNSDRRQRHHRRQQSTPTTFEATHIPFSPATHQQQVSHQRGMSLMESAIQFQPTQQEDRLVDITNTGHQQQQFLQVAQQHDQARPGQQQEIFQPFQLSEEEFRNLQHRQLDAHIDSLMRGKHLAPYDFSQQVVKTERSRSTPDIYNGMSFTNTPYDHGLILPAAAYLAAPQILDQGCQGPASSQSNTASEEKVLSLQPNWISYPQRPFTPPNQCSSGWSFVHSRPRHTLTCEGNFPMTPVKTPLCSMSPAGAASNQAQTNSPFMMDPNATIRASSRCSAQRSRPCSEIFESDNFPERFDINATIKATRRPIMPRGLSYLEVFEGTVMQEDQKHLPSPPNTAPMRSTRTFDVAMMPDASTLENMPKLQLRAASEELKSDNMVPSDQKFPNTLSISSMWSSPEFNSAQYPAEAQYQIFPGGSSSVHGSRNSIDLSDYGSPVRMPPTPRDMPVSDIDLDVTIEDTGISAEEVQSYISEQDITTGKWMCLYTDCAKRFGRKENIRSHVQTHLGDRQYKCVHCNKRFVRQHDLKRHSKIHSGVKPYPCRCGNSFARHDALTRHRQRGICDGGFEGIVKKFVKRGRPRKERPNEDDRTDKAARTRKREIAKSYASSVSGISESSCQNSPSSICHDSFDIASDQLDTLSLLNTESFTYPPAVFSYTPPMSPYSTGNLASPTKVSSVTSPASTPSSPLAEKSQLAMTTEEQEATEQSPTTSRASQFSSHPSSPPELSHSSRPSSSHLMDLEFVHAFNSSEAESFDQVQQESNDADFDMLAMPSDGQSVFDNPWNDNSFANFDKVTIGLRMDSFSNDFDDEALFSDNCEVGDDMV